jgi:arsenate reductase-like glutaredoxin family protein
MKFLLQHLIAWAAEPEEPQLQAEPVTDSSLADTLEAAAVTAAQAVRTKMNAWRATEQEKRRVLELVPPAGVEVEPQVYARALLTIQQELLLERFYHPFELALYELHDDVGKLDPKQYAVFQMKTGILRTQLVELMAQACQGLLKLARALEASEAPQEPAVVVESTPVVAEPEEALEVAYEAPEAQEIPAWLLGQAVGDS